MKNKTIVTIFTLAILAIIITVFSSNVLAYEIGDVGADLTGPTAGKVQNMTGVVIGIVQIIGISIAVIMLIWLGVKYVSAAPNEKADIKKGAMIYIVGAVLMLTTSGILQIIRQFVTQIAPEE